MEFTVAQVRSLLEKHCEDALTPKEHEQLELVLLRSSEARRMYRRFVGIHTLLQSQLRGSTWHAEVVMGRSTDESIDLPELPELSGLADIPLNVRVVDGPMLSLPAATPRKPESRRSWQMIAAGVTSIAALLCVAIVGLYWNGRGDDVALRGNPPVVADGPIAVVRAVDDCQWEGDSAAPKTGQPLPADELTLTSGLVELEFSTGAKVIVEGPATFSARAVNQIVFLDGRLTARVPRSAIGFTVDTPTARIVDLGTEFGVSVSEERRTEVQTFVGKVALELPGESGKVAERSQTISAGQGVVVERAVAGGTLAVSPVSIDGGKFVRSISYGNAVRLKATTARASSTSAEGNPNLVNVFNLIDGGEVRENRPASEPQEKMWRSEAGRTAGEWVVFDLATPQLLHSLKVWNYNEAAGNQFRDCGVGRAGIYVSMTGKDDPATNPAEWSLVRESCKLRAATGRNDYNTPDEMALGKVPARYVAIVVQSTLADDSGNPAASAPFVGLSEVQFFGEPMPRQ